MIKLIEPESKSCDCKADACGACSICGDCQKCEPAATPSQGTPLNELEDGDESYYIGTHPLKDVHNLEYSMLLNLDKDLGDVSLGENNYGITRDPYYSGTGRSW